MILSPEICKFYAGYTLADEVQDNYNEYIANVEPCRIFDDVVDAIVASHQRYIVAAAVRKEIRPGHNADIRKVNLWYWGDDDKCEYVFGMCHPDILHRLGRGYVSKSCSAQGFIDNKGNFVSRMAALSIAVAAGQIEVVDGHPKLYGGCLTSEDLWGDAMTWPRTFIHE